MKIIQISGDSSLTGAPSHLLRLSKGLTDIGHEIIIIAPRGALIEKAKRLNIKTHEVKMRGLFDREADHEIRQIIIAESPQIVHCHGTRGGWLGRLAARKVPRVKIIYTEHLWTKYFHLPNITVEKFQLNGLKFMDRWTDKTIAVSKTVADFMISRAFDKKKIVVIPNGINPEFIAAKRITKPKDVPILIGSVGSLNNVKNYRNAILAFSKIKKEYPKLDIAYQIIGEGPMKASLEALIKSKKLEKNVHIMNRVDSVIERMQHFSIFLNVSFSESFGLAVGEAMAMGLPIVASNIDTLKWLVSDKCGLFVDPHKSDQIAKAIIKLVENEEMAKSFGREARIRIKNKFSEKVMIEKVERLYEETLQK
jgi:glycosyltransferase involved in cell wall biosynthesis